MPVSTEPVPAYPRRASSGATTVSRRSIFTLSATQLVAAVISVRENSSVRNGGGADAPDAVTVGAARVTPAPSHRHRTSTKSAEDVRISRRGRRGRRARHLTLPPACPTSHRRGGVLQARSSHRRLPSHRTKPVACLGELAVVGRVEGQLGGGDVLLELGDRARPGDHHHIWTSYQPRECHLRRRGAVPDRHLAHAIHERPGPSQVVGQKQWVLPSHVAWPVVRAVG